MYAFRNAHEKRDAEQKLDLRNAAGDRVIAQRRIAPRTTITEPHLRGEVARDLEALMNTVALGSSEDLEPFEAVQRSVLNYGLPDIVHRSIEEASIEEISVEISAALAAYEPRLVSGTVSVARDDRADKTAFEIRFVVHAELMCHPVNVPVEFVADVETDTGTIMLRPA
jgi:type VI secretion system protein ImpF